MVELKVLKIPWEIYLGKWLYIWTLRPKKGQLISFGHFFHQLNLRPSRVQRLEQCPGQTWHQWPSIGPEAGFNIWQKHSLHIAVSMVCFKKFVWKKTSRKTSHVTIVSNLPWKIKARFLNGTSCDIRNDTQIKHMDIGRAPHHRWYDQGTCCYSLASSGRVSPGWWGCWV